MKTEELRYLKTLKDGRVECAHIWRTGYQILIVGDRATFDRLKQKVETEELP